MNGPVRAIILTVAVLVLVGGAFWGGIAYQNTRTPAGPGGFAANGADASGRTFQGGPMANLTEEQQAEIEGMTEEERQQWFQENMGAGGPNGDGTGGSMRGGTLEGEVVEVASDSITVKLESGSQTFYTDADTVIAYVEGAGELAAGSTVIVMGSPSSDGVSAASLVVVQ